MMEPLNTAPSLFARGLGRGASTRAAGRGARHHRRRMGGRLWGAWTVSYQPGFMRAVTPRALIKTYAHYHWYPF
jgi:hypothetical protein